MLLSSEDPTVRVMLIGNRVPPNIQRSLDHHGIAWCEITLTNLKEFLMNRNDEEFLHLFEFEDHISIRKFNKIESESQVYKVQTNPEPVYESAEDLVAKIKSSESYKKFRKILPMKIRNEEMAKEILNANLGKLNHGQLKDIIDLIDEPYPHIKNGKITKGPWFGRLLNSNTIYLSDESVDKLNSWFNVLTNSSISVEEKIELQINEPNKIRGLSVGFITLMLYILDKENYLIWFKGPHEALTLFYPDLKKYTGSSKQYSCYNVLTPQIAGHNLKNKLGLIKFGSYDTSRRKFTPEERLSILQEGEREGQAVTIRKYHIAPSLYTRWKHKYLHDGIYGLKDKHRKIDPELRAMGSWKMSDSAGSSLNKHLRSK
jgi:hypothetical protein